LDEPDAVFADITWMGYTGRMVPESVREAFGVITAARDQAIRIIEVGAREEQPLRGWEVDRATRDVIQRAGYGDWMLHRTGHSLGEVVHGDGVHLDDYETHDDRLLLPGTGLTIEPGVYSDSFGVRTEVNMYIGVQEALVTGPRQAELVTIT
jgi:Xaa-Pro aminopeptidase